LRCPLDVCMKREASRVVTHHAPRKIYERAKKGGAPTVPGMGQPYEPPSKPEVALDTTKCSSKKCAKKILEVLRPWTSDEGKP